MSILSKIQSLISAANSATGESDTTLTDAVQTLVDGYGQGGGGWTTQEVLQMTENFPTPLIIDGYVPYTYGLQRHPKIIELVIRNVSFIYTTNPDYGMFSYIPNLTKLVWYGNTGYWIKDPGCNYNPKLEIIDVTYEQGGTHDRRLNDSVLNTIIIRNDTVIPLSASSNFNGTPFRSGGAGGTIYIPKALYDHLGDGTSLDYKAATSWSTVDGYGTITWAQIEGSIYETQYADGTPIPTT